MAAWQELRVGDRVRLVADPPEWQLPGYRLPAETRDLWRLLMARRWPLRVFEVDDWGTPWVQCRVRRPGGEWEHHALALCHGGWVLVQRRRRLQA